MTNLKSVTPETLREAVEIIKRGGVVAFPTETVYGLGADATNGRAIAKVFEVKGRPAINPLISHFTSVKDIAKHAEFTPLALELAEHFWPGPMALVLKRVDHSKISDLVTAGLDTIAVRIPNHPVALQFIERCGVPIAAPSANSSGYLSPTRAEHVVMDIGENVDLILAGGPARIGLESTVIDARGKIPKILRLGHITEEDIKRVLGLDEIENDIDSEKPQSPGQLLKHYAPKTKLYLNQSKPHDADGAFLLVGPDMFTGACAKKMNLSDTGDLYEVAANLFAMLHQLDKEGYPSISIMPIPNQGIGLAINDRLRKAALKQE